MAIMTPLTPALRLAPALLLKAQGIRVVFLDVDGVLTDGGLYFGETSGDDARGPAAETFKRFNSLDGHGIKLLLRAGITPVVITGRDSLPLRARLQALGIFHAHFGTENKAPPAEQTLHTLGLDWSVAAAMGDDWPDLPLLRRSALAAAPANAHIEVRATADWVSTRTGGMGAVRELCDLLLVAGGHYASLLRGYQT